MQGMEQVRGGIPKFQTAIKIKCPNFKSITLRPNLLFKLFNLYKCKALINYKPYLVEASNGINKINYIFIVFLTGENIRDDVDVDINYQLGRYFINDLRDYIIYFYFNTSHTIVYLDIIQLNTGRFANFKNLAFAYVYKVTVYY